MGEGTGSGEEVIGGAREAKKSRSQRLEEVVAGEEEEGQGILVIKT